jgi:hypothetical protein
MPDDDTPQADGQPADDQPAEQSEEQPADSDQAVDQSEEQPTDSNQPAEQAEEQPADSDQPAEQSEGQPAESDQPADQSEEQPADSDQPVEQAEEPAAAADQATEPSEEQPAESDQAAEQSGDATGGGGGGGGSGGGAGGGGPADDAVAAGGGGGDHKLKVIAEFTQEGGQKFLGDIQIMFGEWKDGQQVRFRFVPGTKEWQDTTRKGNLYTTPSFPVATSEIFVDANARVQLKLQPVLYQEIDKRFVFPVPSGDTLRTRFDVEIKPVDETVQAPDADAAKGKVTQLGKYKGNLVFALAAQPTGNQQFHVSGKYYTGSISSPDGKVVL